MQPDRDVRVTECSPKHHQAVIQILGSIVFETAALIRVRRHDDIRNAGILRHLRHHNTCFVVSRAVVQPGKDVDVDIDH